MLYTVINKRFPQLKFLTILHNLHKENNTAESGDISTVRMMSNKSVEYFEVAFKVEIKADAIHIHDDLQTNLNISQVDLSGVHGLELVKGSNMYVSSADFPILFKRLYAPNLKHFKSKIYVFANYLEHLLFPVMNNLVTLNVTLEGGSELSLFVQYLPKFINLKKLIVEQIQTDFEFMDDELLISLKYHLRTIGEKYNWAYRQIRDGNIEIDKIKMLSDEEVQDIIIDILKSREINFCDGEDEEFIDTMMKLIK